MGMLQDLATRVLGPDLSMREGEIIAEGPDTPSPAYPSQIAPRPRGSMADSRSALGMSMVYRAVGIHEVTATQMPIERWHEDVVNAIPVDERRPLGSFLRKPDINMRRKRFIGRNVNDLATTGNCYWLKDLDDQGRTRNVQLLNPHRMSVFRTDGVLEYWYDGRRNAYDPARIQHLKLMDVAGLEYGLGPIQAARLEIEGAIDLRDYSSQWFQNTPQPVGILQTDQVLSDQGAKQAKKSWETSQGGRRQVAVIGSGLKYTPVLLNPKDAQFLENMQYTTTQMARLFGIPASLMLAAVEGSTGTYQNIAQEWLGFVRFSNMKYLQEIEEALSDNIASFDYARFDIEGLLRSDVKSRYEAYKLGIEAKFLLPSEVRKTENLVPVPGIDDRPAPAPAKDSNE